MTNKQLEKLIELSESMILSEQDMIDMKKRLEESNLQFEKESKLRKFDYNATFSNL